MGAEIETSQKVPKAKALWGPWDFDDSKEPFNERLRSPPRT